MDGHTGSGLFGALDSDHDGLLRLPDLRKAMKAAPATVTSNPRNPLHFCRIECGGAVYWTVLVPKQFPTFPIAHTSFQTLFGVQTVSDILLDPFGTVLDTAPPSIRLGCGSRSSGGSGLDSDEDAEPAAPPKPPSSLPPLLKSPEPDPLAGT